MAFGGGSDDIQVKVTLDTRDAEQQAQALKSTTENALKGIASAASNPANALKDLTKTLFDGNAKAAALTNQAGNLGARLGAIAPVAVAVTAAVAGLAYGFKQIIDIAGDGDKFGDISDAFDENARKAGILADTLRDNLSRAFLDTVDSSTLMAQANRAFAAGIDPSTFDDLAAAAKGYADSIGADATQKFQELIQAVITGRGPILQQIGDFKDGVLILDKFSEATYRSGQANRNVTDIYEQLSASLRNTYNEVAKAINDSEALKAALSGLASIVTTLTDKLGGAIIAFIQFADKALRVVGDEVQRVANGFAVLGELIFQLSSAQTPSLAKAQAAVAKQLGETAKGSDKAEKAFVKLKKATDGAGKSAKDLKKDIADAFQQSDLGLNDLFGLESFVLPGTNDSLRSKLKTAFKQINPNDIVGDLKSVREAFLNGITGTPEQIAEETKKRLAIFTAEIQKAKAEVESGVTTAGPRASDAKKIDVPSIFGFDASDLGPELAASIEGALSSAFQGVAQAITSGSGAQAAQAVGAAVGTVIGTAIGAYFGGPAGAAAGGAVGGTMGAYLGALSETLFGGDTGGTKARKEADKFFADMFDENRLSAIINGKIERIQDLVFVGNALGDQSKGGAGVGQSTAGQYGGAIIGTVAGAFSSGSPKFDGENFDAAFEQLPGKAQAAFQAVGVSMEEFLGLSDDISGQIGAVLVSNIGGNIENLQVLVQTLGKTFEELGGQLFEAFFDGTLSLEQLQGQLLGLNEVFTAGLPGIGQVEEAVNNFQIALADGKGSRLLFDSLRDIGAESNEVGDSFQGMAQRITAALGLGADRVNALLQAMKLAGIQSIADLVNASNAQLAALALNIKGVTQGLEPGAAPVGDPTPEGYTPPGNFVSGSMPDPKKEKGGGGGANKAETERKRKEEEAKRQREQAFQSIYKLLTASKAYDDILNQISDSTLKNKEANKAIAELYDKIKNAQERVTAAEKAHQAAIKDGKGNNLGELADRLKKAQDRLKDLTETTKGFNQSLQLDLSKVTPLIGDLNQLGTISRATGTSLEGVTETLVAGFLRGKLSLTEFNEELKKSKEILGEGIPNAVGDVKQAFQNLIDGGLEGGLFSVDAFKDVFAEFQEKFKTESSENRKTQLAQLTKEFDTARDALQSAISGGATPAAIDDLRKQLDGARTNLDEFKNSSDKAGFADLRSELEKSFDPAKVGKFFESLENSGINNFDDFGKASNDTITKILADLQGLGFGFGQTSDDVKKINDELNKSITDANGGKDVLQAALDVIGKFNSAIGAVPGQADAANSALGNISSEFGKIITQIGQLSGNTFENDVIFNVKTNGSQGEKALIDVLFGDGAGTPTETGGDGGGGGPGLNRQQRDRFEKLRKIKNSGGKLTPEQQRTYDRLAGLRG